MAKEARPAWVVLGLLALAAADGVEPLPMTKFTYPHGVQDPTEICTPFDRVAVPPGMFFQVFMLDCYPDSSYYQGSYVVSASNVLDSYTVYDGEQLCSAERTSFDSYDYASTSYQGAASYNVPFGPYDPVWTPYVPKVVFSCTNSAIVGNCDLTGQVCFTVYYSGSEDESSEGPETQTFPMWIIPVIAVVSFILIVVTVVLVVRHKQRKAAKVGLAEPLIDAAQQTEAADEEATCCGWNPTPAQAAAASAAARGAYVFLAR